MSTELTTVDYQTLDQLDEQQIVAELQGALLDQYVYSFESGGRKVVGLSWAGVKAVAAKLGPIACDLLELRDTGDTYLVVVKATAPDGTTRIGAAEQPKTQQTKRGEQPDPFALPKAVSKAQRNAIRALLPETLITEMVRVYLEQQPTTASRSASAKRENGRVAKDPMTRFWQAVRERGMTREQGIAVLEYTRGDPTEALKLLEARDGVYDKTEVK